MWNCLPLPVLGRSEDEVHSKAESQITWRAESSLTTATLRSMASSTSTRKMNSYTTIESPGDITAEEGVILTIDPTTIIRSNSKSSSRDTTAASDAPLVRSDALLWPSTQQRVISSWFNHMLEYLGKVLSAYLAGVADKLEKNEYY